jgi:phosphate-selective porin OprO/OprP
MAWGQLWENFAQYQAGIYNGIEGGFYDLDRNVDFLGSFSLTPWKGSDSVFDSLGAGVSVQTGQQNYNLNAGNTEAFINGAGEPTLNFNYINSTGIPFFQYNDDVRADGMRTKFAPHLFWYGKISVQAEYIWQQRRLADSTTVGSTILQGYQATVAWLLTGESRSGDGLGGWATVSPRSPFSPSRGQCGPGAWELAFQYSEMDVGTDNFKLGFADPVTSTNRIQQTMLGLNWWPNKYTRLSFDWMYNKLNRPVPIGGQLLDEVNTYWTRAAMFF